MPPHDAAPARPSAVAGTDPAPCSLWHCLRDGVLPPRVRRFIVERPGTLLAIFIALFLITRVLLLLVNFELYLHEEEPQRARLGKDLLEGLVQPPLHYQFLGINGGSVPLGFLQGIFFALFGDSYFSLKLCAVALATLGNALFLLFIRRLHGLGPAVVAGLILLVPPTHLLNNQLMEADQHNNFFFFLPLVWMLFLKHVTTYYPLGVAHPGGGERSSPVALLRPLLIGLLAGFATYCYPAYINITFALVAAWFFLDPTFLRRRDFLIFAGAFAVAMVPQLMFNAIAAGVRREFLFSEGFLSKFNPAEIAAGIKRYFVYDGPNAVGWFLGRSNASVPILGFYFVLSMWALMGGYIYIYRRDLRFSQEAPGRTLHFAMPVVVIASTLTYFVVIGDLAVGKGGGYVEMLNGRYAETLLSMSRISIHYRYFTLIFYMFMGMAAVVLFRMMRGSRPWPRLLAIANLAALLTFGGYSYGALVGFGDLADYNDGFSRTGYWYDIPRLNFYKWTGWDLKKCQRIIDAVPERYHDQLYTGLGETLNTRYRQKDLYKSIEVTRSVEIIEKKLPKKWRKQLYQGLGAFVASEIGSRELYALLDDPKVPARYRGVVPAAHYDDFVEGFKKMISGAWSYKRRKEWDPKTRRWLWVLYHKLKGGKYEPCYFRF